MIFSEKLKVGSRSGLSLLLLLILAFCLVACSHAPWSNENTASSPGTVSSTPNTKAGENSSTSGPLPRYYDFEDIPVPYELNIDKDESFIYQTSNFKAGVLVLSGRVDPSSVVSFFSVTLPRENWKLLGGFRYHRSIMVFEKGNRICLINVKESPLKTYVEIYVAPRVNGFHGAGEYKLNN